MSNIVAGKVTKVRMTIDGETPDNPFKFDEGQHKVICTALNFNPASAETEMKLYLAGKVQKELRTTNAELDEALSTAVGASRYRLLYSLSCTDWGYRVSALRHCFHSAYSDASTEWPVRNVRLPSNE